MLLLNPCHIPAHSIQKLRASLGEVSWLKQEAAAHLADMPAPTSVHTMLRAKQYGVDTVYEKCVAFYGENLFARTDAVSARLVL